jgi:TonB family protein
MKLFAVLSTVLVSTTAFAGTPLTTSLERATSTDRAVRRSFPGRVSPARLPSADRSRLSGTHSADVRLCVSPDGAVQSIDLERRSGSNEFDRALASDVRAWRFEPYRAPAGIKVCERITVSYVGR